MNEGARCLVLCRCVFTCQGRMFETPPAITATKITLVNIFFRWYQLYCFTNNLRPITTSYIRPFCSYPRVLPQKYVHLLPARELLLVTSEK